MSKQTKRRAVATLTPPPLSRWQWLTKPWAVTVAVCGALGAFLLNINPILSSVRELPSEMQKTSDQFSSWYFQDASWSGRWINNPEGYLDAEDMNLSDDKIAIDLEVKNGDIGGTIATPQICETLPLAGDLLLEGRVRVTRDSAWVVAWSIIGGHRRNVAALNLERDGGVMTVTPLEGNVSLFPAGARIALDPGDRSSAETVCDPVKSEAFRRRIGEQILRELKKRQH